MRVVIVEPGKVPYETEIDPGLKSMQEVVGGLIQAIYPYDEPIALICNDEGKLQGLPYNRALRDPKTREIYDTVAGTFFLCGAPADSGDFASLSDEQVALCKKLFAAPEVFIDLGGAFMVLTMPDSCQ